MKTVYRISNAWLALRKVNFDNPSSKLRAYFWVLKGILPESFRFIDHNFRPYFSHTSLDNSDRLFLQSAKKVFEAKQHTSLYAQIMYMDIVMILEPTSKTSKLFELFSQICSKKPLLKPLKLIDFTPKAKSLFNRNKNLAIDAAEMALRDTYTLLESLKLEPFLMSGTLLGLIRENRFLSHDIDIDIGVVSAESFETVKQACIKSGFFKSIAHDQNYVLKLEHIQGTVLDIFFHWYEKGQILHGSTYLIWSNSPFDYSSRLFYGNNYRIPKNHEQYLTENYGDWLTPKPEFNILYDTPNVSINQNWDGMIYACVNAAVGYYSCDTKQLKSLEETLNINND